MFELLVKGGPVMVPILLSSVVALAAFLERLYALQRERVVPRKLLGAVAELLERGRISEALAVCERDESIVSRVLAVGLQGAGADRAFLKETMEEAGRRAVYELERSLAVLATVATIAPLLGLLGTVLGMVSIFQGVSATGGSNPAELAGGIWEALITTVAGLTVAIPVFIMHRWLVTRVDRLVLEMEEAALRTADALTRAAPRPRAADPVGSAPDLAEGAAS